MIRDRVRQVLQDLVQVHRDGIFGFISLVREVGFQTIQFLLADLIDESGGDELV
jgi:hypothetical protein